MASIALNWALNNGMSQEQFDQRIFDYVAQNIATKSPAELRIEMDRLGVSPDDVARATGVSAADVKAQYAEALPQTKAEMVAKAAAAAELSGRVNQDVTATQATKDIYSQAATVAQGLLGTTTDKTATDKAAADLATQQKAAADKFAADQAAAAKITADKAAADKIASDKAAADAAAIAASNATAAEKAAAAKAAADAKAVSDAAAAKATADAKAAADSAAATEAGLKAKAEKAAADKVIADKIAADKAATDKAAADKAADNAAIVAAAAKTAADAAAAKAATDTTNTTLAAAATKAAADAATAKANSDAAAAAAAAATTKSFSDAAAKVVADKAAADKAISDKAAADAATGKAAADKAAADKIAAERLAATTGARSPGLAYALANGMTQEQYYKNIFDFYKKNSSLSDSMLRSEMDRLQITPQDVAAATGVTVESVLTRYNAAKATTQAELDAQAKAQADLAARQGQWKAQQDKNALDWAAQQKANEVAWAAQQAKNAADWAAQQKLTQTAQNAYGTAPMTLGQKFGSYESIPIGAQYNPAVTPGGASPYSMVMKQMTPFQNPYANFVPGTPLGGYNPNLYSDIATNNANAAAAKLAAENQAANTALMMNGAAGAGDATSAAAAATAADSAAAAAASASGNAPGSDGSPGSGAAMGGLITSVWGNNPPGPDDGAKYLDIGEYVIKKSSVDKYGKGLLDMINEGKMPAKKIRSLLD